MHGFEFPSAAPWPPTICLTAIFRKNWQKISHPRNSLKVLPSTVFCYNVGSRLRDPSPRLPSGQPGKLRHIFMTFSLHIVLSLNGNYIMGNIIEFAQISFSNSTTGNHSVRPLRGKTRAPPSTSLSRPTRSTFSTTSRSSCLTTTQINSRHTPRASSQRPSPET